MEDKTKAIIESILFISGDDGVDEQQLALALELNKEAVLDLMDEYMVEYNSQDDRGLEIVYLGKRYKLITKASTHSYCQKLFSQENAKQLSQAALETLAIIAYKQPVTRVEIEEIRGVGCDMMIKKLLARNLIRETGRLNVAGKPFQYEVTEEFMDMFKLASLAELPELPQYQQTSNEEGELFD
ncbi:MAG: SMC-Scp complex subunit ScpB [Erysipelotrichaceae bacterium]